MKRLLMVLALAGFAVACGDDDGDGKKVDAGGDAGRDATVGPVDGGADSGPRPDGGNDAGVAAKVLRTGIACETANAATCGGSAPVCRTKLFDTEAAPTIPGNYCSASCTESGQCGDGICLLGAVISNPLFAPNFGTTAFCHQPCATVGQLTGCRQGFICQSVKSLADSRDAGAGVPAMAPYNTGFCYPIPGFIPVDGGTDAGTDGGADAGPRDGGADAGPVDAGSDAGFDAAG
jgi:hypothetical protein